MKDIIKVLRPHQWIKNLLCFAGIIFGLNFKNYHLIKLSTICFVCFSLVASAVYIFNDWIDKNIDKEHPLKKFRPIASGKINLIQIMFLLNTLLISSTLLSLTVSYKLTLIIEIYLVLNIFYTLKGKHIVIIDVFIISLGFLLRLLAGTLAIGIHITSWIILCVFMLTLFLGFAKRRLELNLLKNNQANNKIRRIVLDQYQPLVLDIFIAITSSCAILAYSLFLVIVDINPNMIYTDIFVVYGIFRYIYLAYTANRGEDLAKELFFDKPLLINSIIWLISYMGLIVYYGK
jgi:4-hydroxybenzoate polyprenyltransferase